MATQLYRSGSRGRVQGVRTPPPWDEAFFFVFAFKICLPHRSVTSFLQVRGAPLPKKNPGSAPELEEKSSGTGLLRDCAIIIRRGPKNKLRKEKYYTIPPSQKRQISSDPLQISQKLWRTPLPQPPPTNVVNIPESFTCFVLKRLRH